MRHVYLTSGTTTGFFTACFVGYKDPLAYISSAGALQTELDDKFIPVEDNDEKAYRVVKKLQSVDRRALTEFDYILRSKHPKKEQIAFCYLKKIVALGLPVREHQADDEVRLALDIVQKVASETHLLSGFLRFHETAGGTYYAAYTPDNDVTDLLMPHFFARFSKTPFVIHDVKRQIAGISNGTDWILVPAKNAEVIFSEVEDEFLSLWKKYYNSVNIEKRKNERQMKQMMPVRYWKFMPEKEEP